jgi:YVTN family beta-propeller protein
MSQNDSENSYCMWNRGYNIFNIGKKDLDGGKILKTVLPLLVLCVICAGTASAQPYAYVTSLGESPDYDGTVTEIDISTNKVVNTLDGFYGASDVAITPDGKFAYVASLLSDNPPAFGSQVSVIDVSTNKVVATVDVSPSYGPELVAATPDGKYVYVGNYNGSVSVIDVSTNKVIATLDVGSEPSFIAISPDSQYVYVYTTDSSLYVIEESSNTVFENYSLPPTNYGDIGGIALSPLPEDSFFPLYVAAGSNTGGFGIINLLESLGTDFPMNFSIFASFDTASKQVGPVAVTPDGNFIYVGSSNDVFVLERVNNKNGNLIDTINVGSSTFDLSVTPDGKFVYVLSNNVLVIDVSTNKVVATVDVGGEPKGLAITPDTDTDGVANGDDTDDDNDGIPDSMETATTQTNSLNSTRNEILLDTKDDVIPNERDLDSDGDGIPDHVEAGGNNDTNSDGISDGFLDSDGDGLNDAHDPSQGGTLLPLPDTDGDGVPDFLDRDSDNDGVSDSNETVGCLDADNDGILDNAVDANNDGLADRVHPKTGQPCALLDTDGDGIFDHQDGEDNRHGSSSCAIASSTASEVSFPVYLLIPVFIVIRRFWRR